MHMGHWYNYGVADSYARFMRMNGKNVFQPMGFDAFGLPAENYAIKTGVHPKDSTDANIATMERQLADMGNYGGLVARVPHLRARLLQVDAMVVFTAL